MSKFIELTVKGTVTTGRDQFGDYITKTIKEKQLVNVNDIARVDGSILIIMTPFERESNILEVVEDYTTIKNLITNE